MSPTPDRTPLEPGLLERSDDFEFMSGHHWNLVVILERRDHLDFMSGRHWNMVYVIFEKRGDLVFI